MVIPRIFRDKTREEGREEGREEERDLAIRADKQKRQGESLADAMERLRRESQRS